MSNDIHINIFVLHISVYLLLCFSISTSLMKTSRRLITLILQKCDKHNSKYVMMCSVNMCKVLQLDRVDNKKRERKGERKEIGRS